MIPSLEKEAAVTNVTEIYKKALKVMQDGNEDLRERLDTVDKEIERLRLENKDSPVMPERNKLLIEIERLTRVIENTRKLTQGVFDGTNIAAEGLDIYRGKYRFITTLRELLKHYMVEVGGGPVRISKIVTDLMNADAKVYSRRERKGEDPNTPRLVREPEIRKLISELQSGYSSPKRKSDSYYKYVGGDDEMIVLVEPADRIKHPADLSRLRSGVARQNHRND